MGRGARRVFDVIFLCAFAAFVAIEVTGPAASAPGAPPVDTFTRVDIAVGANGMTVTPTAVPAGQIEFAVTNTRPDATTDPVTVRGVQVPGIVLATGTTMWTQRALHSQIDLVATVGNATAGTGHINMVVPTLAAPRSPDGARRITIDLGARGVNSPYREARLEQPVFPGSSSVPDAMVPWTTATAGAVKLVVRNHTHALQHCALDDGSRPFAMKAGHTAGIAATLQAGGPDGLNFYSLTCTSAAGSARFDLWMI